MKAEAIDGIVLMYGAAIIEAVDNGLIDLKYVLYDYIYTLLERLWEKRWLDIKDYIIYSHYIRDVSMDDAQWKRREQRNRAIKENT